MTPQHDLITIPTIEDLTRRQFMSSALAAALLIACGDDDEEAPHAATRIIDTPMGPVEIPARPQRIAALDAYGSLQTLDELGAPLVAAGTLFGGARTNVSDGAKALPVIGIVSEYDFEAIVAARPDLIIGWQQFGEKVYGQLTEIAPTVLVKAWESVWLDTNRSIADAAGVVDRMDQPLAELLERVRDLEAAIAEAWPDGVRVSVLDVYADGFYTNTTATRHLPSSDLLGQLSGVTVAGDAEPGWPYLSMERLLEFDADVILYYFGSGGTDAEAIRTAVFEGPLWPRLSGVMAGRAHEVDPAAWFSGSDFQAANLVLDDLFKYLT